MKELKLGELYYEISRENPPALSIEPGETVSVETEDTFNGLVRKAFRFFLTIKSFFGGTNNNFPVFIIKPVLRIVFFNLN